MLTTARQRRTGGFSLIELLVAIVVLALMLVAVGPDTADWMRSASVQNAAETVQSGLRRARAEAIRQGRPVTLWLVSASGSGASPDDGCAPSASSAAWVIALDDPSGHCGSPVSASAAPRLLVKSGATVGAGVTVSSLDRDGAAAVSVTFDAAGLPSAGAGKVARIDVAHSEPSIRHLRVQVSEGGAIKLCHVASDLGSDDPRACL